MRLLLATTNRHKLAEIRAVFFLPSIEWVDLDTFPGVPSVIEDGITFRENAVKKAVTLATATHLWAMADDSGLEVEALLGAPGVYSARYAGEPVNYEANNRKLLREMDGLTDRRACFRCAIALSDPDGACRVVEGRCPGRIAEAERGTNGFGYDPVFIPEGRVSTFAEMSATQKNRLSHRAVALECARKKWRDVLASLAR